MNRIENPAVGGSRRPDFAFIAWIVALAVAAILTAGCEPQSAESNQAVKRQAPMAAFAPADVVKRGEYLVTVGVCDDCHTPWKMGPDGPEPDMSRRLSGHPEGLQMEPAPVWNGSWPMVMAATHTAWSGPWGVSYTRNLTPDVNTGIGVWTEDIFINTLRNGRHWGVARPILPPMPWLNYRKMTDDDLRAVFAYLRSIPPVHNRVPEAVIAPPPSAVSR
ncbi:MAG TPA: diheme cytochrome c-553 [Thermoanaerobaculia bacterium]|nr:diheme cytochrome c-553 [Thermoanaerobaculia bacterium]